MLEDGSTGRPAVPCENMRVHILLTRNHSDATTCSLLHRAVYWSNAHNGGSTVRREADSVFMQPFIVGRFFDRLLVVLFTVELCRKVLRSACIREWGFIM